MMRWQDLTTFLHRMARTRLRQSDIDYLRHFIRQAVPWEHLISLAEMEGIAGLLHGHLQQTGTDRQLPDPLRKRLEKLRQQTVDSTLRIISLAETLSTMLDSAAVPVVALQGLSVIDLYPDPGMRPLGDMDIMVRSQQKEDLTTLLKATGFQASHDAYPDLLAKNGLCVDIHTHILNLDRIENRALLFPANLAAMWQTAVPFFENSQALRRLNPFDNFIALASHALKHSYARLIWLVDLNESVIALTGQPDGWQNIIKHARRWYQQRVVLYALVLLESFFGLDIPGEVKETLGYYHLNVVERHLLRLRRRGFSSVIICNGLWLQNIRGVGNKIRFIRETVFPKAPVIRQIFSQDKRTGGESSYYLKRGLQAAVWTAKDLRRALAYSLKSFQD